MNQLKFVKDFQNFYRNKMRENHKTIRIFVDTCILLKFFVFLYEVFLLLIDKCKVMLIDKI
jgi:hypothetical protein